MLLENVKKYVKQLNELYAVKDKTEEQLQEIKENEAMLTKPRVRSWWSILTDKEKHEVITEVYGGIVGSAQWKEVMIGDTKLLQFIFGHVTIEYTWVAWEMVKTYDQMQRSFPHFVSNFNGYDNFLKISRQMKSLIEKPVQTATIEDGQMINIEEAQANAAPVEVEAPVKAVKAKTEKVSRAPRQVNPLVELAREAFADKKGETVVIGKDEYIVGTPFICHGGIYVSTTDVNGKRVSFAAHRFAPLIGVELPEELIPVAPKKEAKPSNPIQVKPSPTKTKIVEEPLAEAVTEEPEKEFEDVLEEVEESEDSEDEVDVLIGAEDEIVELEEIKEA